MGERLVPYSYDTECERLARHFLVDFKEAAGDAQHLAQCIQYAVEDWFAGHPRDERPAASPGKRAEG